MLEYTRRFAEPFSSLAGMAGSFGAAKAAGDRIFALLDAEEEIPESENAVIPEDHSGSVTFENVKFGYTPDRMLINNVNLTVKPGQKVAIVGPTGAGKTTIVNLISRFYDIQTGHILIDDYDVQKISIESLRQQMGVMTQDNFLFSGTIKENLRWGDENA